MKILEVQDTSLFTENPEINKNTSINDTTQNSQNKETNDKQNDWSKFGLDILKSFITVFVFGILGANFVYLTRIDLDYMFPTDPSQRPYTDKSKIGNNLPPIFSKDNKSIMNKTKILPNMTGSSADNSACGMPIDISDSPMLKNKYFKGSFDYGFPYNFESNNNNTVGSILGNWFSNKVKYSHIWLRTVEKTLISFMSSLCDTSALSSSSSSSSSSDVLPFLLGPFIICLILLITSLWFIPSMFSAFIKEDFTNPFGLWISLFGLFFGWTWMVAMCTSIIQIFTSMFTFILIPLLMGRDNILKIIGKDTNISLLQLLFYTFIMKDAYNNLNLSYSVPFIIIFLFKLISLVAHILGFGSSTTNTLNKE